MFDQPGGPLVSDPKLLIGWNQTVRGQAQGLQRSSAAAVAPPAQRRDLSRSVTSGERGKPVALPAGGRWLARAAEGAAGKGRGSKRRPTCKGRIGVATHPARKGADFPRVLADANRQPTGV